MPTTRRSRPALPTQAEAARKPLLGFGWAGWLLLPILISLIVVVATGYDLRYRIQELVLEWFGLQSLMDFTIYGILHTGMAAGTWPPTGVFGPITMSIVLVEIHIHPRRVGVVRLAPLWILGLLGPAALLWFTTKPMKAFVYGTGNHESTGLWEIGGIMWLFLSATLVWLATRSWRVGLLVAACLAVSVMVDWLVLLARAGDVPDALGGYLSRFQQHLGLPMHAALAVILFTWSIRARLHVIPPDACQSCGYDIRGLESPTCPECGTQPQPPIDSTPA